MTELRLEGLRSAIPAARCLPLLAAMAREAASSVSLEYLPPLTLDLRITPCG
jgi:hypothetical protein